MHSLDSRLRRCTGLLLTVLGGCATVDGVHAVAGGAGPACADPAIAEEWVIRIEPIFRPHDPQGVAFLRDVGLRALRTDELLSTVLEPQECRRVAAAVERELADVTYYQAHPYEVAAIEAGPYYFVAVEELPDTEALIVQEGRTLGMVLERHTLNVVSNGWLF